MDVSGGSSDIASLTLRGPTGVFALNFGEDGSYGAYIVPEHTEIGCHYAKVFETRSWLKIFDDFGLAKEIKEDVGDVIEVYRAASFGCIIRIVKRHK